MYGTHEPKQLLFWFVSERENETMQTIYENIQKMQPKRPFALASIVVSDWNRELSPWTAQAAFGGEDFGGGGALFQKWLIEEGVPSVLEFLQTDRQETRLQIGGYSMAGLFALWTFCETDLFQDIAACSGSFWYPGWMEYARTHTPQRESRIYLSLGKKEEKVHNAMLAKIGDCTRELYQMYTQTKEVKEVTLEWNNGNHFYHVEERICKAIQWLWKE